MKNRFLSCILFFALFISPMHAMEIDKDSERIKGVAQFLLERVNYNYVYLFEQRLKDNTYFQCYFPVTYDYAGSGHLLTLLRSGKELWSDAIQQDVNNLVGGAIAQLIVATKPEVVKFISRYIELMGNLAIKIDGVTYPVSHIPVDASQTVKDTINEFYLLAEPLQELVKKQTELEKSTIRLDMRDGCKNGVDKTNFTRKSLQIFIELKDTLETKLKQQAAIFEKYKQQLRPSGDTQEKLKDTLNEILDKLLATGSHISKLSTYLNHVNAKLGVSKRATAKDRIEENNVVTVIQVEKLIKDGIDSGTFPGAGDYDVSEYNRFKRYVVFFAEVSEATSAEQVKALLQEVTLPPVSFGKKRTPGEPRWLITSYVGAALYWEDTEAQGYKEVGGIFAPVGIEYTFYRHHGHSYSAMLAPFDFAHPINLEIENQEEAVKLNDIVIPGIYLSWGYKDLPLTLGIGFNKGRALRTESRDKDRYMFFLAFDLPLLTLF